MWQCKIQNVLKVEQISLEIDYFIKLNIFEYFLMMNQRKDDLLKVLLNYEVNSAEFKYMDQMKFSGRLRILKVYLVGISDIPQSDVISKFVRLIGYRILQLYDDEEASNETKLTKKSEIDILFLSTICSQMATGEKKNERLKEKLDLLSKHLIVKLERAIQKEKISFQDGKGLLSLIQLLGGNPFRPTLAKKLQDFLHLEVQKITEFEQIQEMLAFCYQCCIDDKQLSSTILKSIVQFSEFKMDRVNLIRMLKGINAPEGDVKFLEIDCNKLDLVTEDVKSLAQFHPKKHLRSYLTINLLKK